MVLIGADVSEVSLCCECALRDVKKTGDKRARSLPNNQEQHVIGIKSQQPRWRSSLLPPTDPQK